MGSSKDNLWNKIYELESENGMLASENKCFAKFIKSLGYNDKQISNIATGGKIEILEPIALSNQKTTIDIKGFNNSSLGYKQYGGAEFVKAKAFVELLDKKYLNWKVKRFVPSGYGDGDHSTVRGDLVLTDIQLQFISKIGFRKAVKQILELPDYLECEFESAPVFMKGEL